MNPSGKIYSLELLDDGHPSSFVIRTMEAITDRQQGIADDPHRHNYYSVIWPFEGSGKHIIDFREYPILPHHVFFVSPGQVHQILSGPDIKGLVILFTPEFLLKNSIREDFISNIKLFNNSDETPPLAVEGPKLEKLTGFAGNMKDAFFSETEMRYEIAGAYLKLLLIEFSSHCTLHPGSNTQIREVGTDLVSRFRILVENRFRDWHHVKEYASAMSISPNYLNEVIKASIGIPAKDFILARLLLEAKRTAVFTSLSVKEIAFSLGYEDPSHFGKFFKSSTGQSIPEFRSAHSA
jgi:AraC-like DNA-binding protein